MKIIPKISILLFAIAVSFTSAGATTPNVTAIPTIVSAPGTTTGLTTGDFSASTWVYASGYYKAGDGGGGYFQKNGTGCAIPLTVTSATSTTLTVSSTAGVERGMSVSSTTAGIPSGTTVARFNSTTIWLSQSVSFSGTSAFASGGDSGTTIGDAHAPGTNGNDCFTRKSSASSVMEWGASCNVHQISGTYPAAAGSIAAGSTTFTPTGGLPSPTPQPGQPIAIVGAGPVPTGGTAPGVLFTTIDSVDTVHNTITLHTAASNPVGTWVASDVDTASGTNGVSTGRNNC